MADLINSDKSRRNDVAHRGREVTPLTFEDARIVFRNFSGKEGQYNREGDRNFALILDNEIAPAMAEDGWNVKYLKPREEGDDPQAYMQVSVSYKQRPPRVVIITSRGRTNIPEEMLDILDWAEIRQVDLIVNPYQWAVNGKTGVKAYLKSIYITIEEDELEQKYAEVPDSGQNALEATPNRLELEAGQDPNVIDAEIIDDETPF